MSTVSTIAGSAATSTDSTSALSGIGSQKLSQEDFLKLLVTQMTSQDPLNPQTDTQMAAQMAQFTALQQSTEMSSSLAAMLAQQQTMLTQQQILQASAMLGSTVAVLDDSAAVVTGVVQAVELQDGAPKIVVDGTGYDLSRVLTITPTPVNPS